MESFRVAAGWFPSSLQFIPQPRAICLTLPNHAIILSPFHQGMEDGNTQHYDVTNQLY